MNRGAPANGAKPAPQAQARRPPRGQQFEEDYNIENPRIESEGEDLDAYGEELMRQMREKQKQGGGPLGAGMYADAEEDAQLGPEGLKGQNMAAAGAEQWAVGAHLEAQDSLGSWCAPRSQGLVHARRRPHHLSSAGTRPWSWAAGAWAARAQSS